MSMSQLTDRQAVQTYINDLLMGGLYGVDVNNIAAQVTKPIDHVVRKTITANSAVIESDSALAQRDTRKSAKGLLNSARQSMFLRQFKQAQTAVLANGISGLSGRNAGVDRPQWATDSFECVVFVVANLKFAIPSTQITDILEVATISHRICRSEANSAVASRYAQVFAELRSLNASGAENQHDNESVNSSGKWVVDTGALVVPERYTESMRAGYKYFIEIADSQWLLAADSIASSVVLNADRVRWRGASTRREWLVGMAAGDQRCALIDVAVIDRQLLADKVLSADE